MSNNQLRMQVQSLLQPANQPSQLQIGQTTFSGPRISTLLSTYYAGNDLIIQNAVLQPADGNDTTVVVSGTASFLQVADAPVSAVFQVAQDGIDLMLKYQLPQTWKFSQSFPTLPGSLDFRALFGAAQSSYLDLLTLTDACFLVSTIAYREPQFQVQIAPGLNFICHLTLNGILGGIEKVLSAPPQLVLSGPILLPTITQPVVQPLLPSQLLLRDSPPRPGINLKVEIDTTLALEKVTFKDFYVRIYSPLTNDWLTNNPTYSPGLFFGGNLQIGTSLLLEIVAEKFLGSDSTLVFTGAFDGLTLPSLSSVADLVGADDLLAGLTPEAPAPAFFSHTGSLSLEGIILTLVTEPFSVVLVSLTVELKNMLWEPIPGVFKVSDLAARFQIENPFNAQRSLEVMLFGQMGIQNVPLSLFATAPEFIIQAELAQAQTLPLLTLMKEYLPGVPPVGNLTVDQLYLEVAPGDSFTFQAVLADKPEQWTIELGGSKLAVSAVQLLLSSAGKSCSGTFAGTLTLAGVDLALVYDVPGNFILRGQFPALSMKALLTELCGANLVWPAGFDIDLDQSSILIERQSGLLSLNVAADIKDLGLFALTVEKQNKWAFALGVDLTLSNLAALPGLSVLGAFESFIGLENLLLVLTSLDHQPNFQFPDLAHFNVSSFGNRKVTLPVQANGLSTGLNIYAQLSAAKNSGFQLLAKYLHISLDGTAGITLAVSLPDPLTNTKVFLSVNATIQKGTTLIGELGGFLQGTDVGAYLSAMVQTQVQGQPMEFAVNAIVMENGVLISGTMRGTISFSSVHLSNLAFVIGIDLELIPSLGIAATLDVTTFESSLAVFFDSADPTKSLVAGALNSLSLRDIAQTLAGQKTLPSFMDTVLGLIALKSLNTFHVPAALARSLDNRDLLAISQAFKQAGSVTLPSASDQILLVINDKSKNWHITDLSTMKHYTLTLQGTDIVVEMQPQLYIAPQATTIGSLQYPLGFNVVGEIDYLLIKAQINVQINPQQGIVVETTLAPIVLFNPTFFSLVGAASQDQGGPQLSLTSNGLLQVIDPRLLNPHLLLTGTLQGTTNRGGPQLSLATYTRPQITDPRLRDPHLFLTGTLQLLGAELASVYLLISEQGLTLQFSNQVNPVLYVTINGSVDRWGHLDWLIGLVVGVNRSLDLSELNLKDLGTLSVNTTVNGQLHVVYSGSPPSAGFNGGFNFQNTQYTLPALSLDASSPVLRNIADTLWEHIKQSVKDALSNADVWLTWLHKGAISGAGQTALAVVKVLAQVYKLPVLAIATKMENILGYSSQDVAVAIKEFTIEQAGTAGGVFSTIEQGGKDVGNDIIGGLKHLL